MKTTTNSLASKLFLSVLIVVLIIGLTVINVDMLKHTCLAIDNGNSDLFELLVIFGMALFEFISLSLMLVFGVWRK